MKERGQISIEYLIVVGFISVLVIAIIGISYLYASGVRDQIKSSQIENFAEKIVAESERVYYAGEPSRTTITAYLPAGVDSISVQEQSIIISYQLNSGQSTNAFPSNVPISLSINADEGLKRISIVAQSDRVAVSQE